MVVVGIAGGSGSGKSRLCREIQRLVPIESAVLSHDNYYHSLEHLPEDQRTTVNYDHPQAIDTRLLCEHLDLLRANRTVEVPSYCFRTHTRSRPSIPLQPHPIVFVDGVLIFSEVDLLERLDLSIFVSASDAVRLARRIERDTIHRGRTRGSVEQQWKETVLPMHREFVEPGRHIADIVIENSGAIPNLSLIAKRIERLYHTKPDQGA